MDTCVAVTVSKLDMGSSIIITVGLYTIAIAILNNLTSVEDNSLIYSSATFCKCSSAIVSSILPDIS